ncbi:MAG: flavin reductase family protein [Alphaproteobacteria bacterium]
MFYDALKNDHGLPYNPFKALAVPRPIGWVSTISHDGIVNLSPFSFYNALSYDPPFVMFSAGSRSDGSRKDSVANAEETGELVFNMSNYELRHQMSETSLILEPRVDEMKATGLEAEPSKLVRPPRVAAAPVHFECLYHDTFILPGNRAASVHHVVFAKVIGVHIKDEFITDEGLVDILKIRPIARLGYKDYTSVDSVFSMEKATPEETLAKSPSQAAE